MPAASIQALYDFEAEIETAIKTACTAASVTAVIQRETGDVATPYVAIQFVQGAGMGHLHKHDSVWREDKWEGEVQITIRTERSQNNATHATYRKAIRKVMSEWQVATTGINALLTYLRLLDCKTAGNSPEINTEENIDESTMRYSTPFEIKSSAWPA